MRSRDREPLGRAGGIGIGARGFGDDRDADGVGIRLGGADIAARGLDAAADAAEQVDFVGDVEAGIEAGLAFASAALVAAARSPSALTPTCGQAVDLDLAQRRARPRRAGRPPTRTSVLAASASAISPSRTGSS